MPPCKGLWIVPKEKKENSKERKIENKQTMHTTAKRPMDGVAKNLLPEETKNSRYW